MKNKLAILSVCTLMLLQPITAFADAYEFRTGSDGKQYWYEDGVLQGTYNDPKGVLGDGTVRGREIYDPATDAWYWLDSVYNGAKAVGKEVWIPYIYQNEAGFSEQDILDNAAASDDGLQKFTADCIRQRTGKWVRYDENGKMLKGWVTIEGALADCYPDQKGNTYYYDNKTGLMAKGNITLDGKDYYFDEITGVLQNKEEPSGGGESSFPTINEQVILTTKNVKITATDLEDTWNGPTLNLKIENNLSKNIIIQTSNESVNGYMVDSTTMLNEIEATSTGTDGITFQASSLDECGIKDVASMEFKINILDGNWNTLFSSGVIKVDTSIASGYQQKYDDSGREIVKRDGIRIVDRGLSKDDSTYGKGIDLYIENNTDKNVTVYVRDVYVNGKACDSIIAEEIVPGKKARSEVIFMDYSLEENGITSTSQIKEVKLYFSIAETSSDSTIFDTDVITLAY